MTTMIYKYLTLIAILIVRSSYTQRIFFPDEYEQMVQNNRAPAPQQVFAPPATFIRPEAQDSPPPARAPYTTTTSTTSRPVSPKFGPAISAPQQFPQVDSNRISGGQMDDAISNGIARLTLNIDRELSVNQARFGGDDNVVFSPVSIAEALSLVLLGSNNQTFTELSNVLGFNNGGNINSNSHAVHDEFGRLLRSLNSNNGGVRSSRASGIFVEESFPLRPEYKRTAMKIYDSEIINLRYRTEATKAQATINDWVATKTNQKIRSILSSPPPANTKLIISSALYFKGEWKNPFIADGTQRRSFYPYGRNNDTQVLVDMMANGGEFLYYKDKQLGCQILALPYKGDTTTMYVVLPTDSSKQRLRALEDQLTPAHIDRLLANLKLSNVIFLMPKMRLSATISLRSTLNQLGVRSLFEAGNADLSLISRGETPSFKPEIDLSNRFGVSDNCEEIFETNSVISNCTAKLPAPVKNYTKIIYKKFDDKIGRRFARNYMRNKRQVFNDNIDRLRNSINNDRTSRNPGLYADEVLHKVFIDITETGTEAAAVTSVLLNRGGDHAIVRLETPFLFFIRHQASKLNLFWASINMPTPNYL